MKRLLFMACLLCACGAPAPPASSQVTPSATVSARPHALHVMPHLLVGVAFPGRDSAPHQRISLESAISMRDSLERHTRIEEGEREWFFHAFDESTLYFFVGRYHVRCDGLGCQDYAVEKIYEVPRTSEAERALKVADEIVMYDRGIGSIRAGMSEEQLRTLKGEPQERSLEQLFGVSWWTYPDMRVLVVNGEVKEVAKR